MSTSYIGGFPPARFILLIMVIQNYDSIFLKFTDATKGNVKEAFFPTDRFEKTRVVDHIFINPDFNKSMYVNPYYVCPNSKAPDGTTLLDMGYYGSLQPVQGLATLDIFDGEQRHIVDRISHNDYIPNITNLAYPLHSTIDASLSKLKFVSPIVFPDDPDTGDPVSEGAVNVGVCYCNQQEFPVSTMVKIKTFKVFQGMYQPRLDFKDFTNYGLRGLKIKRITIEGNWGFNNQSPCDKYMTIRTFNGRSINQLPTGLLCQRIYADKSYFPYQQTDLYFDDLDIDEDNSFIENPTQTIFNGRITFYY